MPLPKKIVIVAGEESGDRHAATLVTDLLADNPLLDISGIGGQHMQAAGVFLISDLARYGVTGITEVIGHLTIIRCAFNAIKAHLTHVKPDLLILVDYPGFNLRVATFAKRVLKLRIVYYISPQIWAWKAHRIHKIAACVDKMAVILPFEKAIYQKAQVPVAFVGHPLLKTMPLYKDDTFLQKKLKLSPRKKIVALLPGSRRNEIDNHLPIFIKTMRTLLKTMPELHFVIAIASSLEVNYIQSYFDKTPKSISFIQGHMLEVVACSACVVVASGTASLECALLGKPMCIIYKTSYLTYIAAINLIKVKYLGLCNLLQNKMIVPELLQSDFNVVELTKIIQQLLTNQVFIDKMTQNLAHLKQSLSIKEADLSMVSLITQELEHGYLASI
jgi:lipid-A-disaccharide synthase